MINYCFPQPIYVSDFDSSQIELDYTTSRKWQSNTISSFENIIIYLKKVMIF